MRPLGGQYRGVGPARIPDAHRSEYHRLSAVPKTPSVRDRRYLDSLRDEPDLFTGQQGTPDDPVEPVHLGTGGARYKDDDSAAMPLRHSIHARMHAEGEITVLRQMIPGWLLRDALRAWGRERYRRWKENQR